MSTDVPSDGVNAALIADDIISDLTKLNKDPFIYESGFRYYSACIYYVRLSVQSDVADLTLALAALGLRLRHGSQLCWYAIEKPSSFGLKAMLELQTTLWPYADLYTGTPVVAPGELGDYTEHTSEENVQFADEYDIYNDQPYNRPGPDDYGDGYVFDTDDPEVEPDVEEPLDKRQAT